LHEYQSEVCSPLQDDQYQTLERYGFNGGGDPTDPEELQDIVKELKRYPRSKQAV